MCRRSWGGARLYLVERDGDAWDYTAQTLHLFGDPMLRIRPPRQAVDD